MKNMFNILKYKFVFYKLLLDKAVYLENKCNLTVRVCMRILMCVCVRVCVCIYTTEDIQT